jgi:hypothetical protein
LLALAEEPNLIEAIQGDIATVGLVGEQNNALLVYLGYTSRVLDDPVAIIARGESSAGKSTLQRKVAVLFPPEVKIEAMDMKAAAWFNTTEDHFKHKVFIAGERRHSKDDAAKDAGNILRQLLSEKRINRGVSVQDPETRAWETKWVVREGPIAYAESTTSGSIFEEDLNRMVQIYLDESQHQTRRVMNAIADNYNPDQPAANDPKAIIDRHHEFQLHLQRLPVCRVGVPYFNCLAARMPARKPKARRAIQQIFSIIEVLVVLQQDRREEKNGRLLATLEDYAVARRLLIGPLHAALGIGKDYGNAMKLKAAIKKPVFSTPEVRKALGFNNDMTTSNLLNGLMNAGLLSRLTEGRKGSPATWTWQKDGKGKLETMLLPTVEEVGQFLNS